MQYMSALVPLYQGIMGRKSGRSSAPAHAPALQTL